MGSLVFHHESMKTLKVGMSRSGTTIAAIVKQEMQIPGNESKSLKSEQP